MPGEDRLGRDDGSDMSGWLAIEQNALGCQPPGLIISQAQALAATLLLEQ
jgi:hypothetical protein